MNKPVILLAALAASACAGDVAPLVASDVRINGPLPGMQMAAGYLTLTNYTSRPITITEVTSPQFGRVEMHESVIEDGVARMVELEGLALPTAASVVFEPGGKHLMLMQPADDLDAVTLEFHAGNAVVLTVHVERGE